MRRGHGLITTPVQLLISYCHIIMTIQPLNGKRATTNPGRWCHVSGALLIAVHPTAAGCFKLFCGRNHSVGNELDQDGKVFS